MREPKVAGLVKFSTTDWPGKLAAVVFLQGCPWRCVYCHNEHLLDPLAPATMPFTEVLTFLETRRGLLDGVVFSGGEPLIDSALPTAIQQVSDLGFKIGLHTGGAWPRRLAQLLSADAPLNWVGLDIKQLPAKYREVTGVKASGTAAWESLAVVVASGVAHEVRTTIDPTTHTAADVSTLITALQEFRSSNGNRVAQHVLQEARPHGRAASYASTFENWCLRHVIADHHSPEVLRRTA